MTRNRRCHICGSENVRWGQTNAPIDAPWITANVFYCDGCAKIIAKFEAKLSEILCGRLE